MAAKINGVDRAEYERRMQQALQAVRGGQPAHRALSIVFPDRVFASLANPAKPLTEAELQALMTDLVNRYGGQR